MPENHRSDDSPQRVQFGLGFLFYATAVFAVVSLIFRAVSSAGNGAWPWFRYVLATYVIAITIYLAFRVPVLIRRHVHRRRVIRAKRQALLDIVREARSKSQPAPDNSASASPGDTGS